MTHYRNARLNEQFKREISHILAHKVRDPRVGQVLVTDVRVTPDLWLARVFVRNLDQELALEETLAGLGDRGPLHPKGAGEGASDPTDPGTPVPPRHHDGCGSPDRGGAPGGLAGGGDGDDGSETDGSEEGDR